MSRRRNRFTAERRRDTVAHDRWLLSYSDLVTLLLAVFIVLFAFSRGNRQPTIQTMSAGIHSGFEQLEVHRARGGPDPASHLAKSAGPALVNSPQPAAEPVPPSFDAAALKSQLESVLGNAIDRDEIVMQRSPEGLTISLRDFGFFKSGDARLLPGAADQIKRTAKVLIEHGLEVRVEGHSDDQPIHTSAFRSNWELSTARATAVLSLLVDEAGFPPDRISVAGYGSYRPVAANETPEGRRMNRRVDLVVIAPKGK